MKVWGPKERQLAKRLVNHEIGKSLLSVGFTKRADKVSPYNFYHWTGAPGTFSEVSLNGMTASWSDCIRYLPIVWFHDQDIEGLYIVAAEQADGFLYEESHNYSARTFLKDVAEKTFRLEDWEVRSDDDAERVSRILSSLIYEHVPPLTDTFAERSRLIDFMIAGPDEKPGRLAAALALEARCQEFSAAALRPVMFDHLGRFGSGQTVRANAAIGMFKELEAGLSPARYRPIERAFAIDYSERLRKSPLVHLPPQLQQANHELKALDAGAIGLSRSYEFKKDSLPWPTFRWTIAPDVDAELVVVAAPRQLTGDIEFLPIAGIVHRELQRLYSELHQMHAGFTTFEHSFTLRLPLHELAGLPLGNAYAVQYPQEVKGAALKILAEGQPVVTDWAVQLVDLEAMAEALVPFQRHKEYRLLVPTLWALVGNRNRMELAIDGLVRQLNVSFQRFHGDKAFAEEFEYISNLRLWFAQNRP